MSSCYVQLIQMSRPNLLLIRKMIVSELRRQIHLNPSSELSTDALASQVLFGFLKSCRISTVSSGGTIIIMKMIFCLPYFNFIISLSTHTHICTHNTTPIVRFLFSHIFAAAIHIFICFLYLLTAVFRHLASLHLRTKNANLFLWHSFYLTLSHSSVFWQPVLLDLLNAPLVELGGIKQLKRASREWGGERERKKERDEREVDDEGKLRLR